MLEIKRGKSNVDGLYNYYIYQDDKIFDISFEGNLDLYFGIRNKNGLKDKEKIIITNENMILYSLFDELYENIKNCNIFTPNEMDLLLCDSEKEINDVYLRFQERNEYIKDVYLKNIFIDDKIVFVSDNSEYLELEKSNGFIIEKQDDNYILEFNLNDKRNMYNESIRIRNSRSRYNPFNICFMNLYKKLQNYDPNYHQIDIREYILKMNNN